MIHQPVPQCSSPAGHTAKCQSSRPPFRRSGRRRAGPLQPAVRRPTTLDPVFCPESDDTPEVLGIVRGERQPQRQGMGGNQGVERADGLAATSQRGRDRAEASRSGLIELMQSSEGRCSSRRVATRPWPRRAKLTVSVSSMYRGIRRRNHADPGRAVASAGGFSHARRQGKRGTCPATRPRPRG